MVPARSRSPSALLAVTLTATAAAAATPAVREAVHERKEVAGLAVVFGAEPEPALTEEMQFLRWRVSSLDTEEPYADMEDAVAMVTFGGERHGPFPVRESRRDPGLYQTQHIFTSAGEYNAILTFRKGVDPETHSVDFDFRIRERASLELPPRGKGGR